MYDQRMTPDQIRILGERLEEMVELADRTHEHFREDMSLSTKYDNLAGLVKDLCINQRLIAAQLKWLTAVILAKGKE